MCRQGVEVLKFCILCVSAIECVEKSNLVETQPKSKKSGKNRIHVSQSSHRDDAGQTKKI